MDITVNLTEEAFTSFCAERIAGTKQTIDKSLCEGITYAVRESLKEWEYFLDISCGHNFDLYDDCLSLKEYIEQGYIELHYFEIALYCKVVKPSLSLALLFPRYIKPGDLSLNYPHDFEADYTMPLHSKKSLKTKPVYIFKKRDLRITGDILKKIYDLLPEIDILMPSNFTPAGDWRQTFYNIKTGESFFCNCFKKALKNHFEPKGIYDNTHPHIKYALTNESYRIGICHICTKTIPARKDDINNNFSFSRTYGAYIFKTKYKNKKDISFKEAENIVRKLVDFPFVGEGWPSETLLYKLIKKEFPGTEVIHHGRPAFLGRQEYDIWIPEYKIAVEYQGIQHYEAIEHWSGEEGLKRRQELDKKKLEISNANGVKLIYADIDYDFAEIAKKISSVILSYQWEYHFQE